MTVVVNIFGGPCSGKSVYAAKLYAELSEAGFLVELVREYVKKWAWQGILPGKFDQPFITGQQIKAESMLYDKVDFIISDSPLYQGCLYEQHYFNQNTVEEMINEVYALSSNVQRLNVMIKRDETFWDKTGRYGSLNSAIAIDNSIKDFMSKRNFKLTQLNQYSLLQSYIIDCFRSGFQVPING